jgi:multiple sugar transport system substrate-binding protein
MAVLSLVAVLSACGGGTGSGGTGGGATGPKNALVKCPANTSTTASSAESGNITLTVSGWSSTPAEDALVKQGFDAFHAKYPNITVQWSPIPGDYPTKMRANVASSNVPDVFYLQPGMAQEYIPAGKLLNLGPYMARDSVSPDAYYGGLSQTFDCANGTVFGIPKDSNSLGLVYNKTMFQQAGLGDPSGWSWSDLQSAAQKLTAGNVKGISLSADASRFGAFLLANGGQILSADGKTAAFNSQIGVQTLDFYASFQKNSTGVMPSDVGAGWNGEAFGKQQVAMTFEGGWLIPFMTSTYPSVQYGIAPLPKAPNGQRGNLLFTNAWAAYSGTKHADAAWKLIQYMTGQSYQTQVLHSGFALPTLKSLSNDPYLSQNPNVQSLVTGESYAKADFYGAADAEVHTDLSNAIQSVLLGKADSKTALDQAAQKVNTFIQQNTAP